MARKITTKPMSGSMSHCIDVVTTNGGRQTKWRLCAVGLLKGKSSLSISRRSGGRSRSDIGRRTGGILLCSAQGENSKCVRAPYGAIAYPGGGGELRRKGITVFNGARRKKKKLRKGRR